MGKSTGLAILPHSFGPAPTPQWWVAANSSTTNPLTVAAVLIASSSDALLAGRMGSTESFSSRPVLRGVSS
jgi:hypothetical protein